MRVRLARAVMESLPAKPVPPDIAVGELQETFRHPFYANADPARQEAIAIATARNKYDGERRYPWDGYFGVPLDAWLRGRRVLDLGCFTGGRTAAWHERYGFSESHGIDVDPLYIRTAERFAAERGIRAEFKTGFAEAIPYPDACFDAIVSFDVLEHVRDLRRSLVECRRVLRKGGVFAVVFPSFWHPTEHHLSLATRAPFVHHLFGSRTCVRAYWEILEERGDEAAWYRRESPELEPWERGHTINGTTLTRFRSELRRAPWKVLHEGTKPLGAVGRNATRSAVLRAASIALAPLARLPIIAEVVRHRIVFVLEK